MCVLLLCSARTYYIVRVCLCASMRVHGCLSVCFLPPATKASVSWDDTADSKEPVHYSEFSGID